MAIASSPHACRGVAPNICLWFSRQTFWVSSRCAAPRWNTTLEPLFVGVAPFTWNLAGLTRRGSSHGLFSLFGRITSMPIGDCSPLASVSRVRASCPGSLFATCSDLRTFLEIVTPSFFGVGPSCFDQQVRAWLCCKKTESGAP